MATSGRRSNSCDATSNVVAVNVYDPSQTLRRAHTYTCDAGKLACLRYWGCSGRTTNYIYDSQANLLSRTDPLNHVSSYTYDALNRRTSSVDPLS